MASLGKRCLKVLLAAGFGLLSGCFGVTQNPSYFPYLLPTGDIIQTHAKPGFGYYANFDPHAVRLEVRPIESTDPVRTQHVIIATIYDEKGVPRRARRVEWMLEGAGNIVTGGKLVDEKRTNANNLSGSSISDGNSQTVVKGDMLIVSANTPHQVIPSGGAPIVLMTMHVPYPPTNWPPAN